MALECINPGDRPTAQTYTQVVVATGTIECLAGFTVDRTIVSDGLMNRSRRRCRSAAQPSSLPAA
jgi:hypothetical protein